MDASSKKNYVYNKIISQVILPYCIRVPDEIFQYPIKDINVFIKFRRFLKKHEAENFGFNQKEQIIEKERFGLYDYSIVDIILEKNYFHYSPILEIFEIKYLVLNCIRKFIQFYKLTYDEFWIIEPSINDVLSFHVKCYNNEENIPGLVAEFLNTPEENRIVSFKQYLDEKKYQREEMLTKLRTNFDLPLYTQLMMEANKLYFDHSFDVAVILFDRSFECFFDTLVRIYLLKNNLYEKEWNRYLKMNLIGRSLKDSKLQSYSLKVSKSGIEFNESSEKYNEWFSKCRTLRNDIIHGRKNNIGIEEAWYAMQTTRKAFEFFGWVWYDLIVISDKYFDRSKNVYHTPIDFKSDN